MVGYTTFAFWTISRCLRFLTSGTTRALQGSLQISVFIWVHPWFPNCMVPAQERNLPARDQRRFRPAHPLT